MHNESSTSIADNLWSAPDANTNGFSRLAAEEVSMSVGKPGQSSHVKVSPTALAAMTGGGAVTLDGGRPRVGSAGRAAGLAAACVVAFGLLTLAGWIVGVAVLQGPFSGPKMTPDSAIAFLAAGASLLLSIGARSRRAARVLARSRDRAIARSRSEHAR